MPTDWSWVMKFRGALSLDPPTGIVFDWVRGFVILLVWWDSSSPCPAGLRTRIRRTTSRAVMMWRVPAKAV